MSKKTAITTEHLARMIAKGFTETAKKVDVDQLRADMDAGFNKMESRLDRVETLLTIDYKRRIEKLETEMKELKNALAM